MKPTSAQPPGEQPEVVMMVLSEGIPSQTLDIDCQIQWGPHLSNSSCLFDQFARQLRLSNMLDTVFSSIFL